MQNSLDEKFLGLYTAMANDVIAYRPDLRRGMERDLSRLHSSIRNMGIRVFLEYLPSIRKQLDLALSSGQLHLSGPLTRPYKTGSSIPRLFKGIWKALFRDDGCLQQNVDPNLVAFLRALLDMGNKLEFECPETAVFAETREFYINDVTLPLPSQIWDDSGFLSVGDIRPHLDDVLVHEADQFDLFGSEHRADAELLAAIQRVADITASSYGEFNPHLEMFRHGPGAVSERLRGKEKYLPTRWSPRLESSFPIFGTAVPLGWDHHKYEEAEIPSRLLAVPKTIKGPRLIAAEPSDHLWCQFSIMDFLYGNTKRTVLRNSINFESQEYSREAALNASVLGDFTTIDLKSASDRISCWLVERIFRGNHSLLKAMIDSRTRYVDLSIDKKLPSLIKLRKFTTQGSAMTFPVQSIVFATICIGAMSGPHISSKTVAKLGKQVRVYGDDIIIPTRWFARVKRALELLFLKINPNKTHSTGYFRESCGMDAYKGYDVTPPHVNRFLDQSDLSGLTSVIEASNNFYLKGYYHAAQYLASTVPAGILSKLPVRKDADMSLYLRSHSGNLHSTLT